MYSTNPYAQAGWYNPENTNSISSEVWTPAVHPPTPSLYGALPFARTPSPLTSLIFRFTSLNPDILNSTVVGPESQAYFRVATDPRNAGTSKEFSFFENSQGKTFAVIQWHPKPVVEIGENVPKQRVKRWLALSEDGWCLFISLFASCISISNPRLLTSSRTMESRGKRHTWVPQGQSLCVSNATWSMYVAYNILSLVIHLWSHPPRTASQSGTGKRRCDGAGDMCSWYTNGPVRGLHRRHRIASKRTAN